MRLKHHIVLFLLLLLTAFGAFAQSDSEHAARLFKRYDPGAAYNRITEDVLTLSLSVCAKEPLPFALATAGANPFHVAELLIGGYGYTAERVIFLRSEDCLSAKELL